MLSVNALDFYVADQFAQKIIDAYDKDINEFKSSFEGDYLKSIDMISKLVASKSRLTEAMKTLPQGIQVDLNDKIKKHNEIIKFIDENRVQASQFSDVELLKSGTIYSEINQLIGDELIAAINYLIASQVVEGKSRSTLAEEFEKHYEEEIGHLKTLYQKLQEVGAKCDIDVKSLIENSYSKYFGLLSSDSSSLIDILYNSEVKAINAYKDFYNKWNSKDPALCLKILEIYNDEMEHSHDLDQIGSELGMKLTENQLSNSKGLLGFYSDPKVPHDEVLRVIDLAKNADNELKTLFSEYESDKIPYSLKVPLMLLMKDINTRLGTPKVCILVKKVTDGITPTSKFNDLIRLVSGNDNQPINPSEIILKARNDYLARKPIFDYENSDKVYVNFEKGEANFGIAAGYASNPTSKIFTPARQAEYAKEFNKPVSKSSSNSTAVKSTAGKINKSSGPALLKNVRPLLKFSSNNENFGLRGYEPKWTPPEGLFTKDAKTIAKVLKKLSKSEKQAMARLNFYINRGGKTLSNKVELEKAKKILKKLYADEVNMSEDSNFAIWSGKVETSWTPPEGLFTKDALTIAKVLKKNSFSEKQAMSRLNFFINRGGLKLHNREELEKAKKVLKELYAKDAAKAIKVAADNEVNMSDNNEGKYVIYLDPKSKFYRVCDKSLTHVYLNSDNYIKVSNEENAAYKAKELNKDILNNKHYIRNGAIIAAGANAGVNISRIALSKRVRDFIKDNPGTALLQTGVGLGVDSSVGAGIGALVKNSAAKKMNAINEENSRYVGYSYKDYLPMNNSGVFSTNFSEKIETNESNKNTEYNLEDKLDYLKNI